MYPTETQPNHIRRVGWIGTGVMGAAMAGHLRRAGHEVFVHTRTRARAAVLLDEGAHWCETPADTARQAEIVFTMVGFPAEVEAVYFGPQGLLAAGTAGSGDEVRARVLVDMSTAPPELAVRLAEAAAARGQSTLDAPVSGGDVGARNAMLAIMVGGDRATFDEVRPFFDILGKNVAHMGPAGAGQQTKLTNQIVIAGNMIGTCEALLFARRAGLESRAVLEIIGKGAAASFSLQNLGPRILDGDFDPGFFVEHFVKDLGLVLGECERLRLKLPGVELAHRLYSALVQAGDGRLGTQALIRALERMNGE